MALAVGGGGAMGRDGEGRGDVSALLGNEGSEFSSDMRSE